MRAPSPIVGLNEQTLAVAVAALAARDPALGSIRERWGVPPLWAREPGFSTLLHIILEQQVSLSSARAAHQRLLAIANPLTPSNFLALDDATLREVGFSRQKTRYGRALAQAIIEERLDLAALVALDDDAVRATLVALPGIGPWTADIYLLMALGRPDIWPAGDLALQIAVQRIKQLPARPTTLEMEEFAEPWRPWRSVAARLLWHDYLSQPKQKAG